MVVCMVWCLLGQETQCTVDMEMDGQLIRHVGKLARRLLGSSSSTIASLQPVTSPASGPLKHFDGVHHWGRHHLEPALEPT